jgi:hypothetical protein
MTGRRSVFGALALAGLALCALVTLWAGRSSAAIAVSVPCTGSGGGPQGLINAMQAANSQGGGTISLAPDCTYTLTDGPFDDGQQNGPVGLPIVESAITINGNDAIIERDSGQQVPDFRLLQVGDDPAGVLTIDNAVLRGGLALDDPNGAGAILVTGQGALFITDSLLTDNRGGPGGAITAADGPTVRITGSILHDNHASEPGTPGGAIVNSNGRLIVNNSVIAGNTANSDGGGIWAPAGITKLTNTTMANNRVILGGAGGAIASGGVVDPSDLTVERSTIFGNQTRAFGGRGGGIAALDNSTLTVTDSTISGNNAGTKDGANARGGGIYSGADDASVTTTTIAGNRALGDNASGGGLFASGFKTLAVTASIVAQSAGRNCVGRIEDGGFNLENGQTCDFTDHAVNAKPRLEPLADNGGLTLTRALQQKSPAVNKVPPGRPYCGGTVDQRGVKRPQGPACDIGSFELTVPR